METTQAVAGQRLTSFIERVERLNAEIDATKEDVKEIYSEIKGVGFDVVAVRKIVAMRKIDKQKRDEQDEILSLYLSAIGME